MTQKTTDHPTDIVKYRGKLWRQAWGRLWRVLLTLGVAVGFFYWAWHIERKGGVGWAPMVSFIEWFGPWGKWIIPGLCACAMAWHLYYLCCAVVHLITRKRMEFPPLPGTGEDRVEPQK